MEEEPTIAPDDAQPDLKLPVKKKKIPPWYKDPNSRKLVIFSCFTFLFLVTEFVVGIMTGSLALLADAFHMLSDQLALLIGFIAIRWGKRQQSPTYSYGWIRAEVIGALINAIFLLSVCLFVAIEAIQRFIEVPEVRDPQLVLIVGGAGLVINVIGLVIFAGHSHVGHSHGGGGGHSHAAGGHYGKSKKTRKVKQSAHHHSKRHAHGHGHDHDHASSSSDDHDHDHDHDHDAAEQQASRDHSDEHVVLGGDEARGRQDGPIDIMARAAPREVVNATADDRRPVQPAADEEDEEVAAAKELTSEKAIASRNLNLHGVFLHLLGDALSTIGAMVSGVLMWQLPYDWRFYADPTCSMLITIIIFRTSFPLAKRCAKILMQSVPENIDLDAIRKELLQLPRVKEIHDLHVWQLADTKIVGTVHMRCPMADFETLAAHVKRIFHTHGVHSTTIQPEFAANDNEGCLIMCETDACATSMCCRPATPVGKQQPSSGDLEAVVVKGGRKKTTDNG